MCAWSFSAQCTYLSCMHVLTIQPHACGEIYSFCLARAHRSFLPQYLTIDIRIRLYLGRRMLKLSLNCHIFKRFHTLVQKIYLITQPLLRMRQAHSHSFCWTPFLGPMGSPGIKPKICPDWGYHIHKAQCMSKFRPSSTYSSRDHAS